MRRSAIAGLLAGILATLCDAPSAAAVTGAITERATTAKPFWPIRLGFRSGSLQRPISLPFRRPPQPATVAAADDPPSATPAPRSSDHPLLTLVGTVVGAGGGIAVFIDPTTKDTVRIRTGEDHDGWTLRSVRRRDATFDKDDRSATLSFPPCGTKRPLAPDRPASPGTPDRPSP
jgi:hypothetical protein